jgi:hypothetical protein
MLSEEQHGRFGILNPSAAILFARTLNHIFDIPQMSLRVMHAFLF